ncbi:MAG: galactose oxidase early set domain-containing protein, partial [Pseudomonadota bacterium]
MEATKGDWGDVFDTTIIGIHQVVLEDGRVLYWGGDGNGNAFSNTQKYGIFDPATGNHEILEADHVVRMFCGAGVIIPGTDKVLIAGGNGSGSAGGQIFDLSDNELIRDGANDMAVGRFYPTTVSLSSGQVVILGGNGNKSLNGTPEIFTLGEGWRQLDGATDADVSANWWYPRAWVNNEGEVVYFALNSGNQNANVTNGPFEVMALDPTGNGSIREIGEVPFQMDATSPAVMYDVGKIVIMDASGDLWFMDINGPAPVFTFAADLNGDRNNSDMTVLADGRILLNGGTEVGNSQDINNAVLESVIFDPYTGTVTVVDAEDVMRLYHSSTVLLNDGTVLSMGGGGLNGTLDFMDAQIYTPDYLYKDDGTLADRPEILAAPESAEPGDTLTITVDDASTIARMSFVKTGAVTHSVNMESGRMDLDFVVLDNSTIQVTLPENPNVVGAGNWMLFA